jgi:hypothetical protein
MDKPGNRARRRLTGEAALRRIGAAVRKARPPEPGADDAAPAEYLYVPCARVRYHGFSAETRRWVQEVPIVRKTAKRIYYTSDSWDRVEAVVSPGCISRQEFETDTRCRAASPRDSAAGPVRARHARGPRHCVPNRCRHGYPAGVIPIPGARPGSAGRLFFATRQAAEYHLYRGEHERAGQAARDASRIKELRRAMADAHPDRGGTAEQFTEARHRYQTALQARTRDSQGAILTSERDSGTAGQETP